MFLNSPGNLIGPILPQWLRTKWRQRERAAKRERKHAAFRPNGKREVARRRRQIACGQLRVSA